MNDLSKISIGELLSEVERRHKDVEEYHKTVRLHSIKSLIEKKKLVLAVQYTKDGDYGPNFILGVIKKGKFKDFYYNANIKNYQSLIPDGFHECMESTYEFHTEGKKKPTVEDAITVLRAAGYTSFEEIYE
jgi:hypothetical protein